MVLDISIVTYVSSVLSFLGGLLSFLASLKISESYKKGWVRKILLQHELKKAQKNKDRQLAKLLQLRFIELKLYAKNESEWSSAISEIRKIDDHIGLKMLIRRFSDTPKLDELRKTIIDNEIEKCCTKRSQRKRISN